MKFGQIVALGALALSVSVADAMPAAPVVNDPVFAAPGTTSPLQLTVKTAVPNKVLNAGTYSLVVVDHLTDRMVLRIMNGSGKEETTFLAVPGGKRLAGQNGAGPIAMTSGPGSKAALRGFAFANGATAEFVYPKEEAVPLAKANGTSIPAIDPASEGKTAANKLSKEDFQLVTLWMLTPTLVGTDRQPGIAAARYQAEPATVAVASAPAPETVAPQAKPSRVAPVQEASASVPAPPPSPRPMSHPLAALPHTASSLPLVYLAFGISLLAACGFSFRRLGMPAR